jgi:hypothetical protein
MPDLDEARRQQVEPEATQELLQRQGQRFDAVVVGVILVSESDGVVFGVVLSETALGKRHPVGVAGEVAQDLGGAGEGALGVNVPRMAGGLAAAKRRFKSGARFCWIRGFRSCGRVKTRWK